MRDIIFTASGGYLLEPFKRGDSFPKELIRYSKRVTKAISVKEWGHDMTLFFHDSNEPAAQQFNAEQQGNRTLFYMDRVVKSKLLESVESFVSIIKDVFPDAGFNYLLWDKNAQSFQIKRYINYHSTVAYLDVISYKEREVLPNLEKTEFMQKWH